MKTQTYIILILSAIFSLLFYNQGIGINIIIYTITISAVYAYYKPELLKSISWLSVTTSLIISAFFNVYHHTDMAMLAFVISYIIQGGLYTLPKLSGITATINGLFTILIGFLNTLINKVTASPNDDKEVSRSNYYFKSRIGKTLIVTAVTLCFFGVYYAVSAGFRQMLDNLDVSFISWGFIGFMLLGAIIITGPLKGYFFNNNLVEFEEAHPDGLVRKRHSMRNYNFFSKFKQEYSIGVLLLGILCGLLVLVNASDLYYLFIADAYPESVSRSAVVHEGVNALILSIVMAISVILYFFRGNINFYSNNKLLINLAYTWIWLNALLAITLVFKNSQYVVEYGLTYKRIGVYVYDLLAMIGLYTTYLKISKKTTIWKLLKLNSTAAYFTVVAMCFINWDVVITKYNLNYANHKDMSYLMKLSPNNLPLLYTEILDKGYYRDYLEELQIKTSNFIFHEEYYPNWQSWNYSDQEILKEVKKRQPVLDKLIEVLHENDPAYQY